MMTRRNINLRHTFFRILQVLAISLFIIPPFIITDNGNNMFRFSFSSVELYLFNHVVGFNNFFAFSVAILLFVFLFILFTQVFGRIWCGWLCPQSIFLDLISKIVKRVNLQFRVAVDIIFSAIFSIIFTLILIFYFVSPYAFLGSMFGEYSYVLIPAFIIMFAFFFIDFWLVKYKWCKYICPYAKLQAVMNDSDTLFIGMKKNEEANCIKCLACVRSCPVEIDPRLTPSSECIYCEACIKACDKALSKRGYNSILGYNWGKSFKFTPFRINVVITAIVSLFLFIYFMSLLIFTAPFKVNYKVSHADNEVVITFDINNSSDGTLFLFISKGDNSSYGGIAGDITLRAKEKKSVAVNIEKDKIDGDFMPFMIYDKTGKLGKQIDVKLK